MIDKMEMAMLLFVTLAICSSVYLATIMLLARHFKLAVTGFTLGFGPKIFRKGAFTLKLIPLNAFFEPAHLNAVRKVEDSALRDALDRGELDYYDALPVLPRFGFVLLPVITAFVLTAPFLGGSAIPAIWSAICDFMSGAISPFVRAPLLLSSAFAVYERSSLFFVLGSSFAICTALNVIWLPTGALFLTTIRSPSTGFPKLRLAIWCVGQLLQISWVLAFVVWIARS